MKFLDLIPNHNTINFKNQFFKLMLFTIMIVCFQTLEAKEPPNQISFTEGGIQKTFYRNPNVEAEYIDPNLINSQQNKSLGNMKLKAGWNFRQSGKPIIAKQSKSNVSTKVTEVYNPGVGSGPNIVLPGVIIVSFKKDQTNESLSKLAQKFKIQLLHHLSPRLASFQTESGFLSVEKAVEVLTDESILEAYPETAVEKVLK
ncbi:hypothetical protein [Leptospira bouyouniensis]|uniref:hypothetical protein n=1 Tax=Leptospira bouyouniensis TaxID=2484911 RepID=UPI0010913634|nr:hypothetical protein [Leptospira bouyouniensis]TGM87379.1 hypothetical protein EHQ99_02470 [Leptospira bouyouniensis]